VERGSRSAVLAKSCQEFNQRVLREILELKGRGLEGVVISARWPTHFAYKSFSVADIPRSGLVQTEEKILAQVRADLQADLEVTLSILERRGLRVAVLAPTPQLIYHAPACLASLV
jgi:hypothetical protein